MAALDIILALVLLASLLLGLWRGLVFETLSLAGWVTAFFAAQWLAADVAALLPMCEEAGPLRHAAGFAIVFIATVFVAAFIAWMMKKGVGKVGLGAVDRTLGGLFGALRGLIVLLAVALLVSWTPLQDRAAWRQSQGAAMLTAGLHSVKAMAPPNLARYFP